MPKDEKIKASSPAAAEDVFSTKLDMCLTDTIIKAGSGTMLGAVTSMLFIRRRWPIVAGLGIGIGIAWANCEHELNTAAQKGKL